MKISSIINIMMGYLAIPSLSKRAPTNAFVTGITPEPVTPRKNLRTGHTRFERQLTEGTEFQVNTYTSSLQSDPAIATLNDRGFVVTWQSYGQDDGSRVGVYGQRYDASGAQNGAEFRINTYTSGDQEYPAVAALSDGGFVVTWQSYGQDGSGYGVYGQRYDAYGLQNGAEFRINTYTTGDQEYPAIAALSDGGFVVAWQSYGQEGQSNSYNGVYGQRYDASGARNAAEFRINTNTYNHQEYPAIASLNDGGFVVTWESYLQDGSNWGIYAQRYDVSGAQNGAEFRVSTYTAGSQKYPAIAALSDGGFVVTWTSYGQYNSYGDVYGQRYDVSGAQKAAEFRINTYTSNDQEYPTIASLNDGGFIVAWDGYGRYGSYNDVYGQRYDASGAQNGAEFRINTSAGGYRAAIASLTDGGFVIAWSGVVGQRFDMNGNKINLIFTAQPTLKPTFRPTSKPTPSPSNQPLLPTTNPEVTEFQVNTYTNSQQSDPAIASLSSGGFVVTWGSKGQDGPGFGIYGQRYDAAGVQNGAEFRINTYTSNDQEYPAIAALNDGGFVVTWESLEQDGWYGVYGQRYDASGAQNGAEFRINTYTSGDQKDPAIAALSDGGFVVTWLGYKQDGSEFDIYGQRYDALGAQNGAEFRINTYTDNNQYYPAIASLSDGGFVVTWESLEQDGWAGVYGQRYDASGAQNGAEFRINTYTYNNQYYPAIASLSDGGFVVTWQSIGQDGSGSGVYGQRYNALGAQNGAEFRINTYTDDDQQYPAIASLNDGGYVVTWESLEQHGSWSIYGQRYDAYGAQKGAEFRINTYTDDDQGSSAIASLSDGGFVVTWHSKGQDGSGYGVYGQRFDMNGNKINLPPTSEPTPSPTNQRRPDKKNPLSAGEISAIVIASILGSLGLAALGWFIFCSGYRRKAGASNYSNPSSVTTIHTPEAQEEWPKIEIIAQPLPMIPSSEISLGSMLGEGHFGSVFTATWTHAGHRQEVAVKSYKNSGFITRDVTELLQHEARIMLNLRHDCIVRFFGLTRLIRQDTPSMCLVMELGVTSLYHDLRNTAHNATTWPERLRMAHELSRGLAYLHRHAPPIVHRDIKSLNVILDRNRQAKWCDFGLATFKTHDTTTSFNPGELNPPVLAGTLRWMAPELVPQINTKLITNGAPKTPSRPADIWALGMVLFELLTCRLPYDDVESPIDIILQIRDGVHGDGVQGEIVPRTCDAGYAAIMRRCWQERNLRPTAEEVKQDLSALRKTRRL